VVPDEARRLWRTLASCEDALRPATTTVVHGSRGIAPEGWTGVVRLGDAFLIEAGDADAAVLDLLKDLADPSDPDQVTSSLRPVRTLGPGELAYLPVGAEMADVDYEGELREVPVASLGGWHDSLPEDDVDESSVGEMDRMLVLCRGEEVLGAAGHLDWPTRIGHVGVLVAPTARGEGVGRIGWSGRSLARAWGTVPRSRTTILEEHDGPPLNRRARVQPSASGHRLADLPLGRVTDCPARVGDDDLGPPDRRGAGNMVVGGLGDPRPRPRRAQRLGVLGELRCPVTAPGGGATT
jgi:hypothetical protein